MPFKPDRLTEKTQEAIQQAQALAQEAQQQEITPEHLLLALLQQADGTVPPICCRIGGTVPPACWRSARSRWSGVVSCCWGSSASACACWMASWGLSVKRSGLNRSEERR